MINDVLMFDEIFSAPTQYMGQHIYLVGIYAGKCTCESCQNSENVHYHMLHPDQYSGRGHISIRSHDSAYIHHDSRDRLLSLYEGKAIYNFGDPKDIPNRFRINTRLLESWLQTRGRKGQNVVVGGILRDLDRDGFGKNWMSGDHLTGIEIIPTRIDRLEDWCKNHS